MEISVFWAKLLGLYLVIAGLLCIFRKRQLEALGKELVASKSTMAVSGEINLILGLVIAIDHSIWAFDWKGLITVLGYLLILKGILRFGFPAQVKKIRSKITERGFWLIAIIMLGLGAYLTYCGFNFSA